MAIPPTYHDSDADDEYERSVLTSPILPTDDEASPTDSDPPSTEPTPTTFGHKMDLSPGNTIVGWTSNQCADYIQSLGLLQYMDKFLDNDIVGEALIALRHEELKEMNIMSIGHRLTILKGVYDIKVKQGIPIDSDHWIPPSAEASEQDQRATRDDLSRIIRSMEIRDRKILELEASIVKISEDYRKLREEVLPMIRFTKEQFQNLPSAPGSQSPDYVKDEERSPGVIQLPEQKMGLSRKFSAKRLWLGNPPKSSSPTHIIPQSIPEGKQLADANLDPSPAAREASNHLSAKAPNSGSQPSTSPTNQPNIPSPTSPYTSAPHRYARDTPSTYTVGSQYDRDRGGSNPTPTPGSIRPPNQVSRRGNEYQPQQQSSSQQAQQEEPPPSGGSSGGGGGSNSSNNREAPSVEIFKSFRVSMEDPCEKVLPAALKKYNINADWKNYALYIVYGDQERCLGLREKPLILFKQLDKEGRKPMFMLRRHAAPLEGHSGPSGGAGAVGMGGYDQNSALGGRGPTSSIQLPGGVL